MTDFFKKAENIFLILCMFFGLIFMVVNPPFMASDENSHMAKIYNFTEGSINFQKYTTPEGKTHAVSILPQSMIDMMNTYNYMAFNTTVRTKFEATKYVLQTELNKNDKGIHLYFVPSYTIFSYMPGIITVPIMKLFNVPPLWMMYILRLCSLITYAALTYFAIKITPIKKWLFLICATIPTMLYLAASVNSDGLVAGLCFLFTAYIFNLAFNKDKEQVTKKDLILLATMISYLTVCKFPYGALFFLYFLIPNDKFPSLKLRNKYLIWTLTALVGYTLFSAGYSLIVSKGLASLNPKIVPAGIMFKTLITQPHLFCNAVLDMLKTSSIGLIAQSIGAMGWQNRFMSAGLIFTYFIPIYALAILKDKEETNFEYLLLKNKVTCAVSYWLTITVTMLVCYILLSTSLNDTLKNFQGRYLIPILPLFLIFFATKKTVKYTGIKIVTLIWAILMLTAFTLEIFEKFYI